MVSILLNLEVQRVIDKLYRQGWITVGIPGLAGPVVLQRNGNLMTLIDERGMLGVRIITPNNVIVLEAHFIAWQRLVALLDVLGALGSTPEWMDDYRKQLWGSDHPAVTRV